MHGTETFERGILGVVLLDHDRMVLIASLLQPQHFYLESHQQIYRAMLELFEQKHAIDAMTIASALGGVERAQVVGGVAYIMSLEEGMYKFSEDTIRTYAGNIKQAWKARRAAGVAEALASGIQDTEDIEAEIANAQKLLEEIACDGDTEDATVDHVAEEVQAEWERERSLTNSPAIGFGIKSLDDEVGGMFPGHQVVVGALSGVGKTRFLVQSTAAVCGAGYPVQLNLIEPTKAEVLRGLACFHAGLPASVATEPRTATREQVEKFRVAMAAVRKWPLTLYDRANMTLDEMIARGRAAIRKGCRMIGTDYLQRINVPLRDKADQERLRIARASTAFANLVKDTGCTSLLMSQLKRIQIGSIPTMADLRETGQIENDAHLIVLLHRDYDSEKGIFKNTGAYVVCKRRFGSPTNKRARFDYVAATWEDGEDRSNVRS
jgi:replicative DNA helicase